MKLTPKTLTVLKNFYTINPSIRFTEGNVLRTVSPTKSILAQAKVDVEFPKKFCINDISRFLSSLGLYDNPEIEVEEKQVRIKSDRSELNYVCAAENLVILPPAKNIEMPKELTAQFKVTNAEIQQLFKAISILGLPELAIVGDGENLMLKGMDAENKVQDGYSLNIGETKKKFKAIIKTENFKLLAYDYEVKIGYVNGEVPVAYFSNAEEGVDYWIAVSKDSAL